MNSLDNFDISVVCKELQQKQFRKKIEQYEEYDIEFIIIKDKNGYIKEVTTDINKYNKVTTEEEQQLDPEVEEEELAPGEEEEVWHNKKISDKYKFPMPTFCLNDKKYDSKTYGALMVLSNGGTKIMHLENNRFLYDNSFEIEQLAKDLQVGKSTLYRNIKKLEKLDYKILEIENTKNGIVYRLNFGKESEVEPGAVNKYITINQKMLKNLVCVFNDNAIKLYCLMNYMCNTTDSTMLTESWLCKQIGLNENSEKNQSSIREVIANLELCGYIETRRIQVFKWDSKKGKQVPNIQKVYRLCTFEEWQIIQNSVKNKPIELQK